MLNRFYSWKRFNANVWCLSLPPSPQIQVMEDVILAGTTLLMLNKTIQGNNSALKGELMPVWTNLSWDKLPGTTKGLYSLQSLQIHPPHPWGWDPSSVKQMHVLFMINTPIHFSMKLKFQWKVQFKAHFKVEQPLQTNSLQIHKVWWEWNMVAATRKRHISLYTVHRTCIDLLGVLLPPSYLSARAAFPIDVEGKHSLWNMKAFLGILKGRHSFFKIFCLIPSIQLFSGCTYNPMEY